MFATVRAFAGDSTMTRFRACFRREPPFRLALASAGAEVVVFFVPERAGRLVLVVVTGPLFVRRCIPQLPIPQQVVSRE
jgi:hypothetical protein